MIPYKDESIESFSHLSPFKLLQRTKIEIIAPDFSFLFGREFEGAWKVVIGRARMRLWVPRAMPRPILEGEGLIRLHISKEQRL